MEAIYVYSRKQAIEDGQQFNADNLVLGIAKDAGIKYPVYFTAAIKNIIDESIKYGLNDLKGVLWDIFTMFRITAKKSINNESQLSFKVSIYWKNNNHKIFTFYAGIGATDFDNPDPAITIMTKEDC